MKTLIAKLKLWFYSATHKTTINSLVPYFTQLPALRAKADNAMVLYSGTAVGDRIVVPINGGMRGCSMALAESAIKAMRTSEKYTDKFIYDKRREWLNDLYGDSPKTIQVMTDIYQHVVFAKKIEGCDYIEYLKVRAKNKFN